MKEKGLYRNTVGARKESVQKPFPIRSQNKNKNETHKAQMQVLGVGVGEGESPMLHLEARIKKQLLTLLQHFLPCQCSRFWERNLVHRTHSLLLLEKGIHSGPHTHTAPPSERAEAGQEYFKLQHFLCSLLFSDLPPPRLTDRPAHTALPTTKSVNMHFLSFFLSGFFFSFFLFFGCCSLSV